MNKDDVLKMIKPNAYTYQGMSKRDIKDLQAFSRKSVLINAIRYGGLDGWTNPHKTRQRAEI